MNRVSRIVIIVEVVLAAVGLGVGWWIGTPILETTQAHLNSGFLALVATLPLVLVVHALFDFAAVLIISRMASSSATVSQHTRTA